MSAVEFGLLGPIEVRADGQPIELGPPRQRAVLAILLTKLDAPVPVGELVERLWGRQAPATGVDLVYVYISRLRRLLAPYVALIRQAGGYRVRAEQVEVDLYRFRRLVAVAARSEPPQASALLGEALALWRGPAFGDVSAPALERLRAVLDRERLAARLDHVDLELRAGRHAAVLPRLAEIAAAEPLDERVMAQLMVASYRCGRRAEALSRYVAFRRRLADQLGTDPGPELQAVHQAILRGDLEPVRPADVRAAHPRPAAPPPPADLPAATPPGAAPPAAGLPAAGTPAAGRVRIQQLPAGVATFAGRRTELAELDALLAGYRRARDGTPEGGDGAGQRPQTVIALVAGTAGVGKSALAVHWAHQVATQFPDGQLYVDLHGYQPGSVVAPGQALAGFLRALGARPEQIPGVLADRAAAYRTLLAGRRMVIVLDGASSADQVRPLLPGAPGCLVLVTSRHMLTPLITTEGAHPLTLELPSTADARQLLTHRLGTARVAAEPAAVTEIIARCAALPLALAVVASRAAANPGYPLSLYAADLRDPSTLLDLLNGGDQATDARAAFAGSYQLLSPDAATLLRHLGRHPDRTITTAAAAARSGLPQPQVRRLLTELTTAHLLTEHLPDHFSWHALLHAYAAEQTPARTSA